MLDTDKLKQLKELLDMGAISQEEFEMQKKAVMQPENPKKKSSLGLVITIIAVIVICLMIISGNNTETKKPDGSAQPKVEDAAPEEFEKKCPVEVTSSIYDNIIGVPEIKCTFKNTTDKEIAAIKVYFSPRDVYGEEVKTIFTTNELHTDDPINAGATVSRSWQLLDSEIKSGDIYVYNVYFSDGTEWGSRDASVSDIKKYAYKILTKY